MDQGPLWPGVPLAHTGQTAAALIFGGSAADYAISTDSTIGTVNFMAWYSTWGGACGGTFPCGTEYAQDFVHNTGGLYELPGDVSAYVADWAVGPQFTNYVYQVNAASEPGTLLLLGSGLVGLAFTLRRKLIG